MAHPTFNSLVRIKTTHSTTILCLSTGQCPLKVVCFCRVTYGFVENDKKAFVCFAIWISKWGYFPGFTMIIHTSLQCGEFRWCISLNQSHCQHTSLFRMIVAHFSFISKVFSDTIYTFECHLDNYTITPCLWFCSKEKARLTNIESLLVQFLDQIL